MNIASLFTSLLQLHRPNLSILCLGLLWFCLGPVGAEPLSAEANRGKGTQNALFTQSILCTRRLQSNQPHEARPACEKAVELDPSNLGANLALGHSWLLAGDAATAGLWYQKALPLLIDEAELKEDILARFDDFIARGWQVEASGAAKAWFVEQGGRWLEALRLRQVADELEARGELHQALVPAQQSLKLSTQVLGEGHPMLAPWLSDLARLHEASGNYARAEPLYLRALHLVKEAHGEKHPDTATQINKLAFLYHHMGQYAKAEALYREALSIREQVLGPNHPDTATSLNNLAGLYYSQGQYSRAEPLFQRALAIREQTLGPEHQDTGTHLNNLALVQTALGQFDKAEPLYLRALAILEKTRGKEHPSTAALLNNLAGMYQAMGQYARAEPLYQQALAIREKTIGPDHPDTGSNLSNLAALYHSMGQYDRAEALYQRALDISEKANGPRHPNTAFALNNLALLYRSQGQYERAEPLYLRALAISEETNGAEHPETATQLNNLAGLYKSMGQYGRAEPLFQRALAIDEKTNGQLHSSTGSHLNNLARLYESMGQAAKALPIIRRAWRIALNARDPELLRHTQASLSAILAALDQPAAAIFFGKEGIRTLQGLRANVAQLGKDSLKSYDSTIEGNYRALAKLLIEQNRLTEAERVLELLKEQEVFEFVKRGFEPFTFNQRTLLTPFEEAQAETLAKAAEPLAHLSARLAELKDSHKDTKNEAELKALEEAFAQASARLEAALDEVLLHFAHSGQQEAEAPLAEAGELKQSLKKLGELSGEPVAALYTVVSPDSYHLILTTEESRRAYRVEIKASELNRRIAFFRSALTEPRSDPIPQAQRLLDILLPPEARTALAEARVKTLMWHLDGALRLLPLAALHDGESYLIEKYRLVTFNIRERMDLRPKARWTGLGLGMSQAREVGELHFRALPSVEQELRGIIRTDGSQGVISGKRFLNQDFSWQGLKDQLREPGRYLLIHIASHFHLEPGNASLSFLLTGKGAPISLSELAAQKQLFDGIDLLTLSACETAVGGGQDTEGREMDGLSIIAQKQGAEAVLASLWPVADTSTAELMQNFYRLREEQKLTKAEALRQAQLLLLQGVSGKPDCKEAQRSESTEVSKHLFDGPDPNKPFAHPFYWAPFVLMGNWL